MSVIADIKGLVDDIKSFVENEEYDLLKHRVRALNSAHSISKRSNDAVLQFPVIATRSLDIDTLQIITKSLERNYSTFVQVAVSMDAIIDIATAKGVTPRDIVRAFHTNEYLDTELIVDVGDIYDASTESMIDINKKLIRTVEESLNLKSVNSLYKPVISYRYNFKDPALSAKYNALREAGETEPIDMLQAMSVDDARKVANTKMLQDNDVKKSNELMATTLHVRVKLIDSERGGNPGVVDFLIGIKAMLHPVTSSEMITNVSECYRNNSKVFQFLRWTTGEISFIKDLVLAVDDTKKSAIDELGKGGSRWWNALKRMRRKDKVSKLLGTSGGLIPNATIVMSREEAEILREKYGFDLTKASAARVIMDNYFLLGFVIVDTSIQSASFLFDGKPDFETVSFSGLEKENSQNERKFKEMLKAVNRL